MSPSPDDAARPRRLPGAKLQLLILCAVVVGLTGYGLGRRAEPTAPELAGPAPPQAAARVTVWEVQTAPAWELLEEAGRIEPLQSLTLSAELRGVVAAVGYEEGERIAEGRPLILLDKKRRSLALASAEQRLALARASLELKRKQDERMSALFGKGGVTEDQRDRMDNAAAAAAIEAKLAAIQVEEARADLAAMTIAAPPGLTLVERRVDPGELIEAGAPVAVLADVRRVRVVFRVSPTQLPLIEAAAKAGGGAARVGFALTAGEDPRPAKVASIAPAAEERSRRFVVKLEAANPDGRLRAGLPVSVRIAVRRSGAEVVLPRACLLSRQGLPTAFVIDGEGRARARVLEVLGEREGGLAVAGLQPGERVALRGASRLADGVLVAVEPGEEGG